MVGVNQRKCSSLCRHFDFCTQSYTPKNQSQEFYGLRYARVSVLLSLNGPRHSGIDLPSSRQKPTCPFQRAPEVAAASPNTSLLIRFTASSSCTPKFLHENRFEVKRIGEAGESVSGEFKKYRSDLVTLTPGMSVVEPAEADITLIRKPRMREAITFATEAVLCAEKKRGCPTSAARFSTSLLFICDGHGEVEENYCRNGTVLLEIEWTRGAGDSSLED